MKVIRFERMCVYSKERHNLSFNRQSVPTVIKVTQNIHKNGNPSQMRSLQSSQQSSSSHHATSHHPRRRCWCRAACTRARSSGYTGPRSRGAARRLALRSTCTVGAVRCSGLDAVGLRRAGNDRQHRILELTLRQRRRNGRTHGRRSAGCCCDGRTASEVARDRCTVRTDVSRVDCCTGANGNADGPNGVGRVF